MSSRSLRMEQSSALVTLFEENIPNFATRRWLMEVYEAWGRMVDAFIPNKRNQQRQKFAFVRMKGKGAAVRDINGSNGCWLGGRITVQVALYGRDEHRGGGR